MGTGQVYKCVARVSLAGAFLQSGSVNCEGLRMMEGCLGKRGMLKFEEQCTWAEKRGKMSRGW